MKAILQILCNIAFIGNNFLTGTGVCHMILPRFIVIRSNAEGQEKQDVDSLYT